MDPGGTARRIDRCRVHRGAAGAGPCVADRVGTLRTRIVCVIAHRWLGCRKCRRSSFRAVGIHDADDPDPRERFPKESFYRAVTHGGRVADDGREHLQALAVGAAPQPAIERAETVAVPGL